MSVTPGEAKNFSDVKGEGRIETEPQPRFQLDFHFPIPV